MPVRGEGGEKPEKEQKKKFNQGGKQTTGFGKRGGKKENNGKSCRYKGSKKTGGKYQN